MSKRIAILIVSMDVVWIWGSLMLIRDLQPVLHAPNDSNFYRLLAVSAAGFWIALFQIYSLDCIDGGLSAHRVVSRMAPSSCLFLLFVAWFSYLAKVHGPVFLLAYFAGLFCLGTVLIRGAVYWGLLWRYQQGSTRKVVVLGKERFVKEFVSKILRHPELGYEVVGSLDGMRGNRDLAAPHQDASEKELNTDDVIRAFQRRGVGELVLLIDESPGLEIQTLMARCQSSGMKVSVLPRGYELYTSKPRLTTFDGLPLVSFQPQSKKPVAAFIKRVMDLVVSVALLPLAAVMVGAGAMVLVSKGRRAFRRELRVGMNGKVFWMYRLDVRNAETDLPAYERSLLRLSISEIPQLWNVIRGEMSLVGPRPESPNRVRVYSEWQKQRLNAKAGMTGMAQVNGLRDRHASEEKTRYDLQYMLEWTPFLDVVLMFSTLGAVAKRGRPNRVDPELTGTNGLQKPMTACPAATAPVTIREMIHVDRS